MGEKNTFWKIITQHGIEIPPIQRDYAQGRETPKAKKVRISFLDSIFEALQTKNQLSLDFVYGKIYGLRNEEEHRRNKHAIQSLISSVRDYALTIDLNIENIQISDKSKDLSELVYLIPLDGQQRLTTLFLIHWYVAKRINEKKGLEILKRFRYKTRKSSSACLDLLTDPSVVFLFENEPVKSDLKSGRFYKEIIDLEFFSNSWLNDPTVQAMLNMLQAIHYKAQNIEQEELQDYWNCLISSDLLKFDFLDLQDFNLSDDLYVKMNARGKELSSFENFKAWLFGKIEEEKWINSEIWENSYRSKFDIEWNDVFWNTKSSNIFDIDDAYYRFFKRLLLIDITRNSEIIGNAFSTTDKEITDVLVNDKESEDFDFENFYSDLKQSLISKEFSHGRINALIRNRLSSYFKTIDNCSEFLTESYLVKNEWNLEFLKFWFNVEYKTSWIDLIRNYIVLCFMEHNGERVNEGSSYKDYARVMFNLFNNQTFDSALLYKNAFNDITSINQYIKSNNCDIYSWLENRDQEKNIVFTEDQLSEEIRKWELIKTDKDCGNEVLWVDLITRAESHPCFKGKIGFLLNLAKDNKIEFESLYNKIAPLFEADILEHDKKLLQRALLTKGNYFDKKNEGTYYLFKNDMSSYRARRENWLGFLSKNNGSEILKLVQDSKYNYSNVKESLQNIIDDYIVNNPISDLVSQPIENVDFHILYVYCIKVFDYGESKLIKLANDKYAYQLNKTNTGGYFNDVMLEFIKYNYFALDEGVINYRTKGWDNNPSLGFGEESIYLVPSENKIVVSRLDSQELLASFYTIADTVEYIKRKIS